MRRPAAFLLLLVLALPAADVHAAACGENCGPPTGPPEGFYRRDPVLAAALAVDGALALWTGYELASGNHVPAVEALSLVATIPVLTFNGAVLQRDPKDPVLWGATAVAAAFTVRAAIDVIQTHRKPNESAAREVKKGWEIAPAVGPGQAGLYAARAF